MKKKSICECGAEIYDFRPKCYSCIDKDKRQAVERWNGDKNITLQDVIDHIKELEDKVKHQGYNIERLENKCNI